MSDAAAPEPTAKNESGLRQAVDFGGLLAFGLAFLVMRLRGMGGDEALVQATWFLVAGSAVFTGGRYADSIRTLRERALAGRARTFAHESSHA